MEGEDLSSPLGMEGEDFGLGRKHGHVPKMYMKDVRHLRIKHDNCNFDQNLFRA
jgi:hypothetical protein